MSIKVPAPFAGVLDLGFTAQYRAQQFNEPQRDVPLLFEGPPSPTERLAEILQLLRHSHSGAYVWSDPVMLGDGVVVLAYRDRSIDDETVNDDAGRVAGHVLSLVRPVVFTFLRDCAAIAHLRLSDVIEMQVSADRKQVVELSMPLAKIVETNGERLLWGTAS